MSKRDKAQWVERYALLEQPLYNVVYRVIWDAAESQDIVQEAFLRCWQRRNEMREDGYKAWLFRTALNLAISRRRRARLWRFVGLAVAEDETAHSGDCDQVLPRRVRDAIEALPNPLKHVLLLTEVAGLNYAEVAMALGIKEGTVGSRRTRALAILREQLDIEGAHKHDQR